MQGRAARSKTAGHPALCCYRDLLACLYEDVHPNIKGALRCNPQTLSTTYRIGYP